MLLRTTSKEFLKSAPMLDKESRLKSGDLNSSRLRVLKCLLDDRNSRSVSVPDNRYDVSIGSGYAVLISCTKYIVLDKELDTPYPVEVDTPYSAVDQNGVFKDVQDYALWEVIENGNSWVSVPQTVQENGTSVTKMSVPVTAKEKTHKKNDEKARSLLLMALPNEHQLTFSQYSDAKTMFAVYPKQRFESVQKNMALMAFLDSEVYNDKTCAKTCLKNYETLKKQCDDLIVKLNQTEFTAATYKRGLATVEEQLITYRKNEVLFSEEVAVLKREVACKDYEINVLKSEFKKVKQEKEGIEFKIEKFDNASKSLNKLLESQITDKKPKFKSYGYEDSKQESNIVCDKKSDSSKENSNDSLVKEQVSKDTSSFVESSLNVDKETVFLVDKKIEFVKPKNHEKPVKKSVRPKAVNTARPKAVNTARPKAVNTARPHSSVVNAVWGKPQQDDTRFIDKGCLRHMTGNIAYLSDFKEFNGGYVTFGGGAHGGRISSKGILKSDSLDFKDVYFVNELNFNIFSVSQMCDKKNYVLFTDIECLVLSPNFKLPDESQILIKIPRKDNMYSLDMKNIVPKESLSCLVAKTTSDESMLWHRRLGHINLKNINKLVMDNLVRGLPTKHFENDQTCVACLKGKQHRAFYKSKVLNLTTKPLFMLYMDLFGPTFVSSLMHKKYFLVVTDDYSRFTWVFFLTTKDETSEILMNFIKEIENLVDKKVKIIRSDNGTEFKNKVMDDFYREKDIKREYSVAMTPQQNGVTERRNRTLIEAARTMLVDSKLPTTFWAEAVSKFDGKSNEGVFVGYSLSSKAFRVYNTRTKRVEENLHIRFLENKPMIERNGLKWLFDIDSLTQSMNYVPVAAGTISNESACTQGELNADVGNGEPKSAFDDQKQVEDGPHNESDEKDKSEDDSMNTASSYELDSPKDMFKLGASHTLETTHVEFFSDEDEPEVDLGNITNSYTVPTTPNTRIQKDHPIENVIGNVKTSVQTRRMTKPTSEQGFLSAVYEQKTHDTLNTCLYVCFLSQIEPTSIAKAPSDSSWVKAMQKELLFKDTDHPDKVYKVVKALYGLHQAPRAWYETLANYLLGNGFKRGNIDQTLFIKKQKGDILLVQVYVDDIIFCSTNKELCIGFEKLMKEKFQMSSMGELTFLLGLQVQ
ncbi:putative ribonuclease H-like domain-containing protein [Tanacetum coccineum]|uniref:Ribonuclease H-like domain-containing protein n=1 Tax=Tanacetum coccineum TaxID=301880 RepID=A0ABQ5E7A2_9ASTR